MTGFSGLPIAEAEENDVQLSGVSKILGPRWVQLPVLTIGMLGVQMMWSVEMAYSSPYLMSLGLSKSLIAVALLAGPFSGLIVQPLIGVIADNTKSRFGRRRPYMIGATLICCISMLSFGFTRKITTMFSNSDTLTILIAVLALYGIDFSVNAVQAADRALIVDTLPFSQQPDGTAWAARMQGVGGVLGFFVGNIDLTNVFSFFGDTEIKVLAILSSSILLGTQLWTSLCVKEKVLVSSSSHQRKSFGSSVMEIWNNLLTLPRVIRQICLIQSLAWCAWFPFLFYSTVYIGDLYKLSVLVPANGPAEYELDKEATIIGTRASFYFSIVALTANFVAPLFTKKEKGSAQEAGSGSSARFPFLEKLRLFHICELWAFGHLIFASCMTATLFVHSVKGSTMLVAISGFSWAMTQWAPFSLLGEEILASADDDLYDETVSIRLTDSRSSRISTEAWTGNGEVVWDENEDDVNRDADETHRLIGDGVRTSMEAPHDRYDRGRKDSGEAVDVPVLKARSSSFEGSRSSNALMSNPAARHSRADVHDLERSNGGGHVLHDGAEDDLHTELNGGTEHPQAKTGGLVAKAGIILGIHNLFVVFPQFISSGIAAVIFAIVDPKKPVPHSINPGLGIPGNGTVVEEALDGTASMTRTSLLARADYDDGHGASSVVIIFRLGAIASFLAFLISWRLARELKRR
ncbi:MFS general substrate transporter [Schizopora paradoxa]|uniref:MFS general substrate transporter n=1 Tax=Schizopora paradoxa TaxID=27342 RepID=A0A0H2RLS6_9AGAM|nr:MFS general substrate transporter [Schizopora paradoxa]